MARVISVLGFMFLILITSSVACHAEDGASSCQVAYKKLYYACEDVVGIGAENDVPSQDCCDEVKEAGFMCICLDMPQDAERLVSMKKVIDVCKYCTHACEIPPTCYRFNYTTPVEGAIQWE
ncbi:hypothetical protein Cni_G04238 [Canna indica]|uniref:Bifunctional inhibitor/plant lipid transfer protein/seed storage helical domain-containing protein n=1 Tax=Canna indica TaxID=4628 RepID=A0AAQ3JVL3_9LILI|nr:hypothetical protein Cni_G04238 [Canna indica]